MAKSRWLELTIEVPSEYVEPVAELFSRYGEGGVAIEVAGGYDLDDGPPPAPAPTATVRTYLPSAPAYRSRRELIHIGVRLFSHLHPLPELREREMADREWEAEWKAHFTPLRVGRRLVVCPSWRTHEPRKEEVTIVLDPGLAFGTGHHPTTRRCLESVERLVFPGCRVVDVGVGSGILSIAAAKLGAEAIVGLEVDPVAVRVCRANLRANGVSKRARCYPGTLPHPRVAPGSADLVLANLNPPALTALAAALREALKPDGWLVASGVLQERGDQVEEAFAAVGLQVREALVDDDWVTFLLRQGSALHPHPTVAENGDPSTGSE